MTPFMRRYGALALAAALVFLFVPTNASAAPTAVESALTQEGIRVSRLQIVESEGITIVRGQVSRADQASRIGQIVADLGYPRVANLVSVVPLPDDEAIVLNAERELALTRSLEGCRLIVASRDGVVTVRGTVQSELQKDLATQVIRRISGVRSVNAALDTV